MAAKKYYVVWAGHTPGIYDHWPSAEKQIKGYPGARFKGFPSKAEAEAAFKGGTTAPAKSARPQAVQKAAPVTPGPRADVEIYCDGACEGNPGPCGTGIALYRDGVPDQLWYGLYRAQGTNNIAEILGLHHALAMAKPFAAAGQSVTLYSDSQYTINCVTTWAFGWKAKGWVKKGGDIKNLELIQAAHALYLELKDKITVEHVRGHAGIEGNELADRMSVLAIRHKETALRRFEGELSVPALLAMPRG